MRNEQGGMKIANGRLSSSTLQLASGNLYFAVPFLLCGSVVALVMGTVLASAQMPASSESLGDQLLEDLGPGMLEEGPTTPRNERPRADPTDRGPDLDFRTPGPLDHWGEDIGGASPAAPLPLVAARDGMHQARSLLALVAQDNSLPQAREIQQQVIAQLDQLIEELSKQCQGGQCQADQQPSPDEQPQPGDAGAQAGRGTTAARDSAARLDDSAAKPVEKPDRENLMKTLWGHLPERTRQQMLQSFSDEYLPEYELEIEKYYLRLSEETDSVPR